MCLPQEWDTDILGTASAAAGVGAVVTMTNEQIMAALPRPGLVHVEVTAADEATAREAAERIGALWASSGVGQVWRLPEEDGVRARVWADLAPEPDGEHGHPAE